MKRRILSLSFCALMALGMMAQDADQSAKVSPWKFDGTVGLNAAATGLVNWAAGGKNNVNGIAFAKLHLLFDNGVIGWETNFDTDFGMTWMDQDEDAFQKSSDNIKLATKLGWEFKPTWYLTAMASFQSQYALGRNYKTGYNDPVSKWLAPSYTDISIGIDWKKSVNGADFSIYLSPIAGRITSAYTGERWNERYTREAWLAADPTLTPADWTPLVYDALKENHEDFRSKLQAANGTIGYDRKTGAELYRNARAEFGLSFKGSIAYTYKDLKLSTTLGLFTPYQGKGFNEKEVWEAANPGETYTGYFEWSNRNRHFGLFDVDWDVALSYQFLKCLQVTVHTNLKYFPGTLIEDKDGIAKERCQFKGVIGLGVGYSF